MLPPSDAMDDSWEACLQAVRDCDVMLVLFNGNAGWAKRSGDIGICHAEYMEGLAISRGKVRLIAMPNLPVTDGHAAEAARKTPSGTLAMVSEDFIARIVHEAFYSS